MQEQEVKPNYYAILPANVRYDKKITPNAKLLYTEITALCNKEGYCWATNKYFANLYQVSSRSIQNWIACLVENNYLKIDLIYKENTKEIIARHIYLNFTTTSEKNFTTPIEENFIHNIKSSLNIKEKINNLNKIINKKALLNNSSNLNKENQDNKEVEDKYFNKTFYNEIFINDRQSKYKKYSQFVYLTEREYTRLIEEYTKEVITQSITELNLWKLEKFSTGLKGDKNACKGDDYLKIRRWVIMKVLETIKKTDYKKFEKLSYIYTLHTNPMMLEMIQFIIRSGINKNIFSIEIVKSNKYNFEILEEFKNLIIEYGADKINEVYRNIKVNNIENLKKELLDGPKCHCLDGVVVMRPENSNNKNFMGIDLLCYCKLGKEKLKNQDYSNYPIWNKQITQIINNETYLLIEGLQQAFNLNKNI